MTWALIGADSAWLAGPFDNEPDSGAGERVVEVAAGYPDLCLWSQLKGGFVDVVQAAPLISVGRFKLLFTQAERVALRAAAKQSPAVEDFMDLLAGFTEGVSLSDSVMIAAIEQLQAGGLLSAGRAAAVLAGTPPA